MKSPSFSTAASNGKADFHFHVQVKIKLEKFFSTSLLLNILRFMKCSSDRNK